MVQGYCFDVSVQSLADLDILLALYQLRHSLFVQRVLHHLQVLQQERPRRYLALLLPAPPAGRHYLFLQFIQILGVIGSQVVVG